MFVADESNWLIYSRRVAAAETFAEGFIQLLEPGQYRLVDLPLRGAKCLQGLECRARVPGRIGRLRAANDLPPGSRISSRFSDICFRNSPRMRLRFTTATAAPDSAATAATAPVISTIARCASAAATVAAPPATAMPAGSRIHAAASLNMLRHLILDGLPGHPLDQRQLDPLQQLIPFIDEIRRCGRRRHLGRKCLLDVLVKLLPNRLQIRLEQFDGIRDLPLQRVAELLVDALLEFRVPLLFPEHRAATSGAQESRSVSNSSLFC